MVVLRVRTRLLLYISIQKDNDMLTNKNDLLRDKND